MPISIPLGEASLTGAIASGIISALTKKHQQKLKKVMRLIDIITPALVVFERVVSGALKNGVGPAGTPLHGIDEEEFYMLQALHFETLNELTGIDHRMEAEHRSLVKKKPIGRDKRDKKNAGTRV